MNKTPEEACRPLVAGDIPSYTRFCDASYGPSVYKISLIDCLNAVYKALKSGFFNFDDFDAEEYEYYEVIVAQFQGKKIAFSMESVVTAKVLIALQVKEVV